MERVNQKSRRKRPQQPREVEHAGIQGDGVWQILAAFDQLDDEGLAGRDVKRVDQSLKGGYAACRVAWVSRGRLLAGGGGMSRRGSGNGTFRHSVRQAWGAAAACHGTVTMKIGPRQKAMILGICWVVVVTYWGIGYWRSPRPPTMVDGLKLTAWVDDATFHPHDEIVVHLRIENTLETPHAIIEDPLAAAYARCTVDGKPCPPTPLYRAMTDASGGGDPATVTVPAFGHYDADYPCSEMVQTTERGKIHLVMLYLVFYSDGKAGYLEPNAVDVAVK